MQYLFPSVTVAAAAVDMAADLAVVAVAVVDGTAVVDSTAAAEAAVAASHSVDSLPMGHHSQVCRHCDQSAYEQQLHKHCCCLWRKVVAAPMVDSTASVGCC